MKQILTCGTCLMLAYPTTKTMKKNTTAVSKDLPHQEDTGKEATSKPTIATVGSHENG